MGFLDNAKKLASKHADQVEKGIEKAGDIVDKKTGGKHRDKIRKAQDQAKVQLDKLDGKNDDLR